MTPDRVRELIDAFGADSRKWPVEERDAAMALLKTQEALQSYAQDATSLDALLREADIPAVPAGLAERVLEDAASAVAHTRYGSSKASTGAPDASLLGQLKAALGSLVPWRTQGEAPLWQPAIGLAASLAIGLWVGSLGIIPLVETAQGVDVAGTENVDDTVTLLYGGSIGFEDWANDG